MKRACSIAVLAALTVAPAFAQDSTPTYIAVDCMRATAADYEQIERETWQPVHQYLVENGKRASWGFFGVVYGDRSRCDYHTVTTYSSLEQLNADPDWEEAFAAVHPRMNVEKVMEKTLAARELVSTELWLQLDQTELKPFRFAIVNKMYAEDPLAYETMESKVFKAGHQVLVDRGQRSGWAIYTLVSPIGSSIPYNYGTVDFVNELGPVPMAEAMMEGNPDRDLDAMAELLELRDHVLSETWALIAGTETPAD